MARITGLQSSMFFLVAVLLTFSFSDFVLAEDFLSVAIDNIGLAHQNRHIFYSCSYRPNECSSSDSPNPGYLENVTSVVDTLNYGNVPVTGLELDFFVNNILFETKPVEFIYIGGQAQNTFSVIVSESIIGEDNLVHLKFNLRNGEQTVSSREITFTPEYNIRALPEFYVYRINSTRGLESLRSGEQLIVGENYSITARASGNGYESALYREGKTNFNVNFSINSSRIFDVGRVRMNLSDGVAAIMTPDATMRIFNATVNFTLKSEYVRNGSVSFLVFWNSGNELPESGSYFSDNRFYKTLPARERFLDLAVNSMTFRNSDGKVIDYFSPGNSPAENYSLKVDVGYANLGDMPYKENISIEVFVNTITKPLLMHKKIINGINGSEAGSTSFLWRALIGDTNCPYGECTFFVNISTVANEINKSNNNLTRDFDVAKIYSFKMADGIEGNIPEYYNRTAGKFLVVRRNSVSVFYVEFTGRNASFECFEPSIGGELRNCSHVRIETRIGADIQLGRKYAVLRVLNMDDSPVGFYKAYAGLRNFAVNRSINYSVIFNSNILAPERDAYLFSIQKEELKNLRINGVINRTSGRRSDYSFLAYSHFPINGRLYRAEAEPVYLAPQDNHVFELALSAINGQTNVIDALKIISTGIYKSSNYSASSSCFSDRNVPFKLKDIDIFNFTQAATNNDFVFSEYKKMQIMCFDYSYIATAMYRSIGIPSRQVGANNKNFSSVGHSWVEAYAPGFDSSDSWIAVEPQTAEVYKRLEFPTEDYVGISTAKPGWKYDSVMRYIFDRGGNITGLNDSSFVIAINMTSRKMQFGSGAENRDHYFLDCNERKYLYNATLCP